MKRFLFMTLMWAFALQPAVFAAEPVAPSPPVPAASGAVLLEEARAGSDATRILEVLHDQKTLQSKQEQHLLDDAFARFQNLAPTLPVTTVKTMRDALRTHDSVQEVALSKQMLDFTQAMVAAKTPERQAAWNFGAAVVALELNATKYQQHEKTLQGLAVLRTTTVFDSMFPAMAELRQSLVSLEFDQYPTDDWQREAITVQTIDALLNATTGPSKPVISGKMDTPSEPIAGLMALRSDGLGAYLVTTYIDLIFRDGTVKSIAGSSEGTVTAPQGRLHCSVVAQPTQPVLFAIPLTVPSMSKAQEPSLDRVVQACHAYDLQRTPGMYQPGALTYTDVVPIVLYAADRADMTVAKSFVARWAAVK